MPKTILQFRWPDKTALSKSAFTILKKLRKSGYDAYLAGGAVRDALLKKPLQEIDIATSARPNEVEKLFRKTIPTGKKHGTITVRLAKTNYEVTTFRVEGLYQRHRWPQKVRFVKTAKEDAKRRDFTINALFYDVLSKQVIDYVQGLADLAHRQIRLVGEGEERIREDALRMLRAVRFVTTLGFDLARETRKAIQKNAKLITRISGERIKQELDRIISSPRASVGFGLLDILGLLEYLLPELKVAQGVRQPKNEHAEGDVYAHSLLCLEQMDETFDLPTRYALLFHDLGKVQTRAVLNGKITFYGHPALGAELSEKISKRLKFSTKDTLKISWLVKNHLVPNDFAKMRLSTRRKWGLNLYFRDLLRLYQADAKASLPASGKPNPTPLCYLAGLKILKDLEQKPELSKPLISGSEVMKILKIPEGPLVGKVLKVLDEKKLSGKIKTKIAARKFLKKRKKFFCNLCLSLDKNLSTL